MRYIDNRQVKNANLSMVDENKSAKDERRREGVSEQKNLKVLQETAFIVRLKQLK